MMLRRVLALLIVLAWLPVTAFAGDLPPRLMAPFIAYPIPGVTRGIATADFNGDGVPDIVVSNADAGTISVSLNAGDGRFHAPVSYAAGSDPREVITTDLNHDGHPDIAVGVYGANWISTYLGHADGSFTNSGGWGVGDRPLSIAAADLDGDGHVDLVGVSEAFHSVTVLLGHGDGTFADQTQYPTGKAPQVGRIADVTRDGIPDLVTFGRGGNPYPPATSVLPGNGDGTFQPHVDDVETGQVSCADLGDVDGDGRIDAVYEVYTSMVVRHGLANGMLGAPVPIDGAEHQAIRLADLDGDGVCEVVATGGSLDAQVVQTFHATTGGATATSLSRGGAAIAIADFDRDGSPDVALASQGAFVIHFGRPNATLVAPVGVAVGGPPLNGMPGGPTFVSIGDLDGDGLVDLASVERYEGTATRSLQQDEGG